MLFNKISLLISQHAPKVTMAYCVWSGVGVETVQNVTLPTAVVTVLRGGPARSVTNVSTSDSYSY